MNKFLLFIISVALTTSVYSQNYKYNRKESDKIKRNGNAYWVECTGYKNLQEAESSSIDLLMTNIYENCNPSMILYQSENGYEVQPQKLFNTLKDEVKYSSEVLYLDNTENYASVFRYIKKDDFISICDRREQLINSTMEDGLNKDSKIKSRASIGEALRYYYWSLILCCSHPYGSELVYNSSEDNTIYVKDFLYDKIDSLLTCVRFIPKKKPVMKSHDNIAYELAVTDGSDLVPWLKFEYNDGNSYVESFVESGKASVELTDKDINEVEIKVCIENMKEAEIIAQEAYSVMSQLESQLYFASAIKMVNVKKAKDDFDKVGYHNETIVEKKIETDKLISENAPEEEQSLRKSMATIEKAIRQKNINNARGCFTDEGFEMFSSLLNSGNYFILGTPEYKFLKFKDQTICRSIPMQFKFKNNVGLIRDVVFRFDNASGKVNSLSFRLTEIAEIDILGKDQWNEESRLTLINFLEDYQTAYALKRIDYLDKIFSDDALIVVGTILKQKRKTDNIQLTEQALVRYDTLSKEKYIEKLHKVFTNNDYVNIRFLDTDFAQHNSGIELYGIRVKQEYTSSNYGDMGYLFLMVDLREDLPVIHVRTWEPETTGDPICFDDFKVKILD
ncbi:MAG: hypothetical protein IKQ09_08180 [Bacteroidales bacterium]|nr:hypothetical protein [Bacteroidales bacterium]